MLEIRKDLEGKKILIWGFGLEGQSTYRFLKRQSLLSNVSILDSREIDIEGIEILQKADFKKYDLIFKSPGIVIEEEGFPFEKLTSQTDLFLKHFRNQTVGVTGSKGKSTTSSLIAHALKVSDRKVVLVGNIGLPCLDSVERIDKDTVVVFELSCHQLEYVTTSPTIAVFLNLFPEHLDHYGSFEAYGEAKKKIARYQKKGDVLFVNDGIPLVNTLADIVTCSLDKKVDIFVKDNNEMVVEQEVIDIPPGTALIGVHNYYNAGIAYGVLKRLGLSKEQFEAALLSFKPLAHRLESIGVVDGVEYIDDSISTIPQATIQAICSLSQVDCVLIGGMDRGIDYEELVEFLLNSKVETIIFMYESGKRVAKSWKLKTKKPYFLVENLQEAVAIAKERTAKGKMCLLSPAAASYGDFKNFEDRGDQFKKLVREEN